MGNCWSCGAPVSGLRYMFTCPACAENPLLKSIKNGVEGQEVVTQMIALGLSKATEAMKTGLAGISDELSNLAGIVQSGFDEIKWELQQQAQVLLSIDQTLKSPSQTQAREWREMAEQLRKRGCLAEAEQWFLKSIQSNPLDFRTYIGLAMNYLRQNEFDKAEQVLTQSIPHAPTGRECIVSQQECERRALQRKERRTEAFAMALSERVGKPTGPRKDHTERPPQDGPTHITFNYQSLSHRLIGRICACRGDYGRAAAELQSAIDLSPDYPEGNYDYALYSVQAGRTTGWEEPMRRAISLRPGYLNVARVERRFGPARQELKTLLSGILSEAYRKAQHAIHDAATRFAEAERAVSNAPDASEYECDVNDITPLLVAAKNQLSSNDYVKILDVPAGVTRAAILSDALASDARRWTTAFAEGRLSRQREVRKFMLIAVAIVSPLLLGGIIFLLCALGKDEPGRTGVIGFACILEAIMVAILVTILYKRKFRSWPDWVFPVHSGRHMRHYVAERANRLLNRARQQ